MGGRGKRKVAEGSNQLSESKENIKNNVANAVQRRSKGSRQSAAVLIREDVATNGSIVQMTESVEIAVESAPKRAKKQKSKVLECSIAEEELPKLRQKAAKIHDKLMALYDDPPCPLDHQNHFQLLVSIMLSAQSTDKKARRLLTGRETLQLLHITF